MIAGILIMMIAFFNKHLIKYDNYFNMCADLGRMTFERYMLQWPPRVMPMLALIPFGIAIKKIFSGYMDLA